MSYSFFGTCANDHKQLFGCLHTILNQTILPKELILVDSGDHNIEKKIVEIISEKKICFIYISRKLSRVKALNIALDLSSADFSMRFDSRARFSEDYAENALKFLNNKSINAKVVGGIPEFKYEIENFESKLCAEVMGRPYVFLYPKHRRNKFEGYSSSLYLGCFNTKILKQIKFRETTSIISEDSLIISDFNEKTFKSFISHSIKVSYITRSSFVNILMLFNTYGYCRANTILFSKRLFISKRHFFVFVASNSLFIILIKYFSISSLVFLPLLLFLLNLFGEIFLKKKDSQFYLPFYATLCQFSWIIGFIWNLMTIFKRKNIETNFIS